MRDPVDIGSVLLVYGPLGVMAILGVLIAVKMYRDRETDRKRHDKEMRDQEQRHIAKADSWVERYHELAVSLKDALDAAIRRMDRR